jgi:hypothetical protein
MAHGGEAALGRVQQFRTRTRCSTTSLPASRLEPWLQGCSRSMGEAPGLVVGAGGRISLVVAAAFRVRMESRRCGAATRPGRPSRSASTRVIRNTWRAISSCMASASGTRDLRLVIDGDLDAALPVTVDRDGRWRCSRRHAYSGGRRDRHPFGRGRGMPKPPPHRWRTDLAWTAHGRCWPMSRTRAATIAGRAGT